MVLDSAPLGLLTDPKTTTAAEACRRWASDLQAAGVTIYVPEIIDYELRRELIRAGKITGLTLLDRTRVAYDLLLLNSTDYLLAAELWAQARQGGFATAADKALDIDVILAAQALNLALPEDEYVVATSNVAHLTHFVRAEDWRAVTP